MTKDPTEGLAHSAQVRLVRHAHSIGVDPNLVLTRFAVERFLYRLSRSAYGERFVLKGALLLLVWLGETLRATRDADLLGFGELSDEDLLEIFREVCKTEVEPDGMRYDPTSIRLAQIRPQDAYGGRRITLEGRLGPARLRVQIDVGIGDAVTPEPEWLEYPSLLDLPSARMRAYPPETVIAEKLEAMVSLGSRNSRLRDYFDVLALAQHSAFEGDRLVAAVRATFERRRTPIPETTPVGLMASFASQPTTRAQWAAFRRRNRLEGTPENFGEIVARLAVFLEPVLEGVRGGTSPRRWPAGGPWQ